MYKGITYLPNKLIGKNKWKYTKMIFYYLPFCICKLMVQRCTNTKNDHRVKEKLLQIFIYLALYSFILMTNQSICLSTQMSETFWNLCLYVDNTLIFSFYILYFFLLPFFNEMRISSIIGNNNPFSLIIFIFQSQS